MNIFYLSEDPAEAARFMVDRHIVKMPTESAQMLSTTHRVLDGRISVFKYTNELGREREKKMFVMAGETVELVTVKTKTGVRRKPAYVSPDGPTLYSPTHANHPSAKWTMSGVEQYNWHYELLQEMLKEYTFRYGKIHGVSKLLGLLKRAPRNIPKGTMWTPPALAMPDQYKTDDHVESYRKYYIGEKSGFARWKNRPTPEWFMQT